MVSAIVLLAAVRLDPVQVLVESVVETGEHLDPESAPVTHARLRRRRASWTAKAAMAVAAAVPFIIARPSLKARRTGVRPSSASTSSARPRRPL